MLLTAAIFWVPDQFLWFANCSLGNCGAQALESAPPQIEVAFGSTSAHLSYGLHALLFIYFQNTSPVEKECMVGNSVLEQHHPQCGHVA